MTVPQPAWVRKRDGRLVPFEADRISRALFAATEAVGSPDAFLGRELADAAVHFLAEESEGTVPTTEQVHDVVLKVLRELKQHALAAAFDQHSHHKAASNGSVAPKAAPTEETIRFSLVDAPAVVRDACLSRYTLHAVFTRDLMAAHQDGVVSLGGLLTPDLLHSAVVGPTRRVEDLLSRLEEASGLAGQTLAFEGIEHVLAQSLPAGVRGVSRQRLDQAVHDCVERLAMGLRLADRRAVVNLNGPPPPWAAEIADGPLFVTQSRRADTARLATLAESLAEALPGRSDRVRLHWHLADGDVVADAGERLTRLARLALQGTPLAFVFDRPRYRIALAEGLCRGQEAVLLAVGLHLPRLARLVIEELPALSSEEEAGAGVPRRSERFLEKLPSLARLALSAALQKREYLRLRARERPALVSGFVVERARLLAVPLGLDESVRMLTGQGLCAGDEVLDLGRSILTRLRTVLRDEGRASTLETCLDAAPEWDESGPTCWEPDASAKSQLRTAGSLHVAAGGGSAVVFLADESPVTPEQVAGWLRWAWDHSGLVRVRFVRVHPPLTQMTFSEE